MGNKFVSAAGDNPLLKARPPADRRGAQMKAPSERAPRGKYAGGVLEFHHNLNTVLSKNTHNIIIFFSQKTTILFLIKEVPESNWKGTAVTEKGY